VRRLLTVLVRLVEAGNTVVVIEHNLDVIKCADWIIDLGPEGGAGGGSILVEGPPDEIARTAGSYTGRYLKPVLDAHVGRRARGDGAARDAAQPSTPRAGRSRKVSGDLLG
jgi:excinuclease ABC subunit A